jgi:hypothetical protein
MSRIALSSLERAQREILPLDLALYHAAREYPGGAAAIAATTGRNPTTLQHKLSPTHPSHSINIQEFGEILELTKDRRILDAVHALVGDTIWQELADTYTNHGYRRILPSGRRSGRDLGQEHWRRCGD